MAPRTLVLAAAAALACLLSGASAAVRSVNVPTVRLCNGADPSACVDMPRVGQGSCCGTYNISSWLSQGGIHIDTSQDYGSQPNIAAAIASSGIPREQLFITSKLNVESCATNMTAALYSLVLQPLNMSYVDLLLLHHAGRWETDNDPHPPCFNAALAGGNGTYYNCRLQTVVAFEAMRAAGLIRAWGVSNWNVRDLQQMYDAVGYYPPINQIEFHPYWNAREVVSFCNRHGILVEAYAPMGDGDRTHMRDDPIFPPIAAAHNASIGQTIMSWSLATGADIVIPRSSNATHQAENLALFAADGSLAVKLNETEIAAISAAHPYGKAYHTDCQPWC